jgi:hypothetical protein
MCNHHDSQLVLYVSIVQGICACYDLRAACWWAMSCLWLRAESLTLGGCVLANVLGKKRHIAWDGLRRRERLLKGPIRYQRA